MGIECVWVADPESGDGYVPGRCFYGGYDLSAHYVDQVASIRPPISVLVPMRGDPSRGTWFCVDSHPTSDPAGAWEVTVVGELVDGERPDITVTPSINCVGIYHGHLTHGVLSDDIGD